MPQPERKIPEQTAGKNVVERPRRSFGKVRAVAGGGVHIFAAKMRQQCRNVVPLEFDHATGKIAY